MYQCPNCGGQLKFNIENQMLTCEQCRSPFDPYSIKNQNEAQEDQEFDVTVFKCPQCGGEIMSSDTTAADFCSFCGASTILNSRMSKEKKPSYIIPFKVTKEQCKNEYSKLMRKALFAPKELKDPHFIDGFRGIYVPYWTYDILQQGPTRLDVTKSHRSGDYILTDHYNLSMDIDCQYRGLSYDASSSFDDNISEGIAPFDVRNMNDFTPTFLSGFYADIADVGKRTYEPEAKTVAKEETFDYIKKNSGVRGYTFKDEGSYERYNTKILATDRTLFPVWFLSYRKNDRVSYAVVNGQTGKISADIPISKGKYLLSSLLVAIPIFLLLNAFLTLRPSVTLTFVAALAMFLTILYYSEMRHIVRHDMRLDDKGYQTKHKKANDENADALEIRKKEIEKTSKKSKKSKSSGNSLGNLFLIVFFIIWGSGFFGPLIIALGTEAFSSRTLGIVCGVFAIITAVMTVTSKKYLNVIDNASKIPGSVGALISVVIATLIMFINPVDDWIYYAAVIVGIASEISTMIELISYYNILATRRLPQFDMYRGGDDRA